MANYLEGNVWEIDTAGTTELAMRTNQPLRIKAMRWVGGTTAGHTCIATDSDGHVVFSGVATAANYTDRLEPGESIRVSGLKVTTLASGKLYVYL